MRGPEGQNRHHGEEQPELLKEGFYALETAVRIVLRKELGIQAESWPAGVHDTNLKWPMSAVAERLSGLSQVNMRRVEDDERGAHPPDSPT